MVHQKREASPEPWMLKCSPLKQHHAFTGVRLASPLLREDLRFIIRRPERVMSILQKVDARERVPLTWHSYYVDIILTTEFPLRLSLIFHPTCGG